MSLARAIVQLIQALLWALVSVSLVSGGSARASSERPYPKQGPISHALPDAVGAIACEPLPQGAPDDYLTCAYIGPNDASMTFYLFVPAHYDASASYPLTLILHGSGERAVAGETAAQQRAALLDNGYVAVWGPGSPPGEASIQATYPSFVVAPQMPMPDDWVNTTVARGNYALQAQPTTNLSMAMVIVELLQKQYTAIDVNRRYITGISMGAFGVWDAIERWPGYFAAAVPVAGAGSPALAWDLRNTPVWAFQGAKDVSVPPSSSREMVLAVRDSGGYACYTLIPDAPHAIWDTVYGLAGNPNNPLYPWLFTQRESIARPRHLNC